MGCDCFYNPMCMLLIPSTASASIKIQGFIRTSTFLEPILQEGHHLNLGDINSQQTLRDLLAQSALLLSQSSPSRVRAGLPGCLWRVTICSRQESLNSGVFLTCISVHEAAPIYWTRGRAAAQWQSISRFSKFSGKKVTHKMLL